MSRMKRFDWAGRFLGRRRRRHGQISRQRPRCRRLAAEPLEDRRMLATFTVTTGADSGADSLRDAIASANSAAGADEITFDASLSGQTISLTSGELEITEALAITGLGQDDLTISGMGASRIFNITAPTGDFTIAGLTLTGGTTTGESDHGGAIRSHTTGQLMIERSTITGNSTTGNFADGGGVYAFSDLTITDSDVSGNSTAGLGADGGGIWSHGNVTLARSTAIGNSTSGDGAQGGGVGAAHDVTLTDSAVSSNSTTGLGGYGGGVVGGGNVTLTRSNASGNRTAGAFARGGGVSAVGDVTLIDSTVGGNSTAGLDADGGGVFSRTGAVTLTGSTISGNTVSGDRARGGGVFSRVGALTLTDSTLSGNRTTSADGGGGGGLYVYGAVTITRSTVIGNSTAGLGAGGIFVFSGPVTIAGSIVAGNMTGGASADVSLGTGTLTARYSLIGDNAGTGLAEAQTADADGNLIGSAAGTGVIDPLLGPLSNNGGPTETHALLVGSGAIDAGDPFITFDPAEFDQRGDPFVRVFDGDGTGDARIDMGAYESRPINVVVDTLVDESDGDFSSGDLSLREAIEIANGGRDTINFDAALDGGTILLVLGELTITGSVTIDASNLTGGLTVDAVGNDPTPGIDQGDGSRVLMIDDGNDSDDVDVEIRGLTLTGGDVNGRGGSIYSRENLTLTGSTITGSHAFGGGGGVYAAGAVTLTDSTVTGNRTTGQGADGGGVYARGDVTLTDSTVSGNSTAGEDSFGGGVAGGGAVTLTRSTVSGNSTAGEDSYGGGVAGGGDVTITESTVSGNSAAGFGGSVFAVGDVVITESTVSGNSTSGFGRSGGGVAANGDVTLTDSTVSGNSTAGDQAYGGGVWALHATLTESTISGNSTVGSFAEGGGVWAFRVTVTDSTVTDNHVNHATASGGGLWAYDDSVTITGSIVAGNTAGSGNPDLRPGTGTLTARYSLIGDSAGTALVESQMADADGNLIGSAAGAGVIDPLLGPLTGNGGPTETHALLPGSPAIDAGDPAFVPPPDFDQRGSPHDRLVDGDGIAGARIDMGALEVPHTVFVDTDQDVIDAADGLTSLREAIDTANTTPGTNNIIFASALGGSTLSLTLGELEITDALVITGLGQDDLTIDAQGQSRIFNIDDGGVANNFDVTIIGLTLTGGKTTADFDGGGAIRSVTTGNLTIDQSTISGNSTGGGNADGGGVYARGAVTLTQSTVSGNRTVGFRSDGGGVYAIGGVSLSSSTVSGNSTAGSLADGGGIWTYGAVTITRSTVTENHANAAGGGIWNNDDPVTIVGSIVAGNTAGGGSPDLRLGTGTLAVHFSLIGDNAGTSLVEAQTTGADGNLIGSGTGAGIIDPLLGPLANNGGPTETHILLLGSPAINAGDPAAVAGVSGVPEFDQRGDPFDRILGGRIDIGAVEVQNVDTTPPVVTAVGRNGGEQNHDKLVTLALTFSEDISATLDKLNLVLKNTSTQTRVDLAAAVLSYDGATNTATWDLSGTTINTGFHTVRLLSAFLTDTAGNRFDGNNDGIGGGDFVTNETDGLPLLVALPGDLDLDGDIDTRDIQTLLAANSFNNPGAGPAPGGKWFWVHGDFNNDGLVETGDILLILATNRFGNGAYAVVASAATGEPLAASRSPVESIAFSAPGVSVAIVGDGMPKHNLRAPPIDVFATGVSKARDSDVVLKHNFRAPEPAQRWALRRRAAEVDRVLADRGGEPMDDLVRENLTGERYPLERIWDVALLASLDDLVISAEED